MKGLVRFINKFRFHLEGNEETLNDFKHLK